MKARADDLIWWLPLGARGRLPASATHLCPTAVIATQARRDQLDPMALGTCRYCHEPLPVPA